MKGHPPSPSPFLAEGETCGSLRSKMKSRRQQYGGTLLGLAFGLVVGVLISFGVVWYLNKTPLPFVEKVSKQEPREKNGAAPAALPGKPGDKPISSEKKFEFYDILDCDARLSIDVRTIETFAGAPIGLPLDVDGNVDNLTFGFDPGGANDIVAVRVFYEWDLITPYISMPLQNMNGNKHLLQVNAVFRNEPFGG